MQTFPRDDGMITSQRARNQSAARATEVSHRTGNESRSRRNETFQHRHTWRTTNRTDFTFL